MATAQRQPDGDQTMVLLTFRVPKAWRDALAALAHRQRISVADLLRIMVRGFMRERLTEAQRAELEVD